MADGSLALARAVGIWLTLVAVESIQGVMRRLFLEPQLGDLRARQVSVFIGAVLIALVFCFTPGDCGRNREPLVDIRIAMAGIADVAKPVIPARKSASRAFRGKLVIA